MSLLLITLSFALAEEDAAAKKLYNNVAKKIASAKSLKVEFTGSLKGGDREFGMQGTAILANGNKVRIKATMTRDDTKREMLAVCDGKKRYLKQGDSAKTDEAPTGYAEKIQKSLSRFGPSLAMFMSVGPNDRTEHEASNFQLLKNAKVGKREAKVLKYRLTRRKEKLDVTVWIDAKTNLPFKRLIEPKLESDRKPGKLTETATFTLNPKLDAKTFNLPE